MTRAKCTVFSMGVCHQAALPLLVLLLVFGCREREYSDKTTNSSASQPAASDGTSGTAAAQVTIDIESVNGVTVVAFLDRKILDQAAIQKLGDDLIALVEQDGCSSLVLDFRIVEFMSSAIIGKLIILDRKASEKGGKLVLCNLSPEIKEVFVITQLDQVFDLKDTREEALAMFHD
jgi:anti-sigma B factor antagonist